jgi:hypothetical protein
MICFDLMFVLLFLSGIKVFGVTSLQRSNLIRVSCMNAFALSFVMTSAWIWTLHHVLALATRNVVVVQRYQDLLLTRVSV